MKLKYILSDFHSFFTILVCWSRWRAQKSQGMSDISMFELSHPLKLTWIQKSSLQSVVCEATLRDWIYNNTLNLHLHRLHCSQENYWNSRMKGKNLIKGDAQTILIKHYSHNKMRNRVDTRVIKASQCGSEYEVTFMNV